jgi:hypothetical protein
MPAYFKSSKTDRRSILALGAAFSADPILLPTLLRYGTREKSMRGVMALCLGRFRSPVVSEVLRKIIRTSDHQVAADALYSLAFQGEEHALDTFKHIIENAKYPSLKAHGLMAAADSDLAKPLLSNLHRALKDLHAEVRSAAALSLVMCKNEETPMLLAERLRVERDQAVITDLLLSLALVGGSQYVESAAGWAEKVKDPLLAKTAQKAVKGLKGKLDLRMLKACFEKKISHSSGRWEFRFRDAVMREIYKGLELDRIMRKTSDSESTGGTEGEQGTDGGSSDGGTGAGAGGGSGSGGDDQGRTAPGGSDDEGQEKKSKFDFREEVIEWDLLQWFEAYPYFPSTIFSSTS